MSPQKRYSNFTSTTILAQNTDGWQSNWVSSYQNILSGTPTKMRVSGTAPSIKRSFNTIQANDQHTLTYTQTGNNSINLLVEQSPNGSTWNAIYNAATSNGNNTHSFTPTQNYLRVSYDANAAFEIGDVVLSGMHVDALVDYSIEAKLRTIVGQNRKKLGVVGNDFLWGSLGNLGANSFGKEHLLFQTVGTGVSMVPTTALGVIIDKEIEK